VKAEVVNGTWRHWSFFISRFKPATIEHAKGLSMHWSKREVERIRKIFRRRETEGRNEEIKRHFVSGANISQLMIRFDMSKRNINRVVAEARKELKAKRDVAIRKLYQSGLSQIQIGMLFGLKRRAIAKVIRSVSCQLSSLN
jgi:hypothetical protein